MKRKRSNKHKENVARTAAIVRSTLDSPIDASAETIEPVPLEREWSKTERDAILDYLHGDIPRDEVKACCYYEYARTSEMFRRARRVYEKEKDLSSVILADLPVLLKGWRGLQILICPDFPNLPWRELSEAKRKEIARHFLQPQATPLITNSVILEGIGVFDQFKREAEVAKDKLEKQRPPQDEHPEMVGKNAFKDEHPAMVGKNAVKYVVVTLDYREGLAATKQKVSQWLSSPVNKELFEKYYKKPIHKQNPDSADRYKELLKYLAAWRLYDELGLKAAKQWTKKHRRQRADALKLRRFFRERSSKALNISALYDDGEQWDEAKRRAQSFLATEIESATG
jgi:hypothetical protein